MQKQGKSLYLAQANPEHQRCGIIRVLSTRQVWQALCMFKLNGKAVQRLGPHAAYMPALMLSRDQDLSSSTGVPDCSRDVWQRLKHAS